MCINLIENAIKYTDVGSVKITLTQSNQNLQMIIEDTGVGIPKEQLPYIFDRFFRVDKSRVRETGGSGLGLSIVQSIIRLHNGEIYAESEVETGTKFTVIMPKE